jgi:hypothetical protein
VGGFVCVRVYVCASVYVYLDLALACTGTCSLLLCMCVYSLRLVPTTWLFLALACALYLGICELCVMRECVYDCRSLVCADLNCLT